ncbi:hypothetical protein QE408_001517 [Agrobacterium larrymoorei]|uniref:Uncharacterized protein n=1 Tax=Agrobacterium larrymoorei TaxID=160699 RepID=A0ABU0UHH6_9HYPH|nr:hypothetical protein [Agrobacterium larrymoorei]
MTCEARLHKISALATVADIYANTLFGVSLRFSINGCLDALVYSFSALNILDPDIDGPKGAAHFHSVDQLHRP